MNDPAQVASSQRASRHFQPTLRLLLVLTFSGVALALVALLSVIIGQISARQLERDARQSLTVLAAQMAGRMSHELIERYSEIVLIASTDVALRTPTIGLAQKGFLLTQLQEIHPDYAWIGFVAPDGTVLVATDNLLVGASVGEHPWFRAGSKAPFLGDVHEALVLSEQLAVDTGIDDPLHFVDFAAPVVSENGVLLGVLGAQLNWHWARQLEEALLAPVTSADVEIFVVDQDGSPLLTPPGWQGTLPVLPVGQNTLGTQPPVTDWPDGKRYITGTAMIQSERLPRDLGWSILVRQPVATAYAPAWRTQWQIVIIGVSFAALFALAAWWLANRITQQLVTLTRATEAIYQGEGGSIPILTGTTEVASLSTALNQLISDLTTAREAERNRIARDLHDSVTQTLFSTSMLADVLPKVWESDPALGRAKLDVLRRAVRGALGEMRTLLLELRPTAIAEADVQQLMRQLADSTTGRTGVHVTWQIEGKVVLPPDCKVAMYRTMQEALNNVVKHAEADQASLLLR
ncbi:MAG: hypothetical protein KDE53_01685, partial [Caldilineaceae bacterium]|nr:hypothetical protein [Caldilineaceae bacterium]